MRDDATQAYAEAGVAARVEPFIADMAGAYAWADVVVCRAGALTLAELCAVGVGSVLVPFPQAVDDHQTKQRRVPGRPRRRPGCCRRTKPSPNASAATLEILCRARRACCAWRSRARALAQPDAAERVADIVLDTIQRHTQEARA